MCYSHLPCHVHAMLRPCRSSQDHGTARPSRDGLWAACQRSASSGYHAEFHEGCYQKRTNLRCRRPVWNQTTFITDEEKSGSSTLQKRRSVSVGLAVRIFSATTRTFTTDTALTEHGRGAAWARHAMCESTFSPTDNTRQQNFTFFLSHEGKYQILIELLTLNSNM